MNIFFAQSYEKIDKTLFHLHSYRYASDIHTGISLFEDLSEKNPEDKRDYIYYLAIANTRVKKFEIAQKFVKAFLELEPTNQQVLLLDVSFVIVLHSTKRISIF